MKEYSSRDFNANHEMCIDTFMPHLPKIIVDRPIHPERRLEEAELMEEYEKVYAKYGL